VIFQPETSLSVGASSICLRGSSFVGTKLLFRASDIFQLRHVPVDIASSHVPNVPAVMHMENGSLVE
jgi:hypothetical protein